MSNHASCIRRSTRPRTAKVVDAEGNLRRVEITAGVADLMLEALGHVVARVEEVVRTRRRMSGLQADEELRPREMYLLLLVDRVRSKISDRQIAVVIGTVEGGRRRRRGKQGCGSGRWVFPAVGGEDEEKGGEENRLFTEGKVAVFPGQRIGGHRQWRPVLDTIRESN